MKFTFITQCDESKTLHPPPPQLTLCSRYLGCHEERRCVTTLITVVKDYDFFERVSSKTLCAFPALSLLRARPSYETLFLMVFQESGPRRASRHIRPCKGHLRQRKYVPCFYANVNKKTAVNWRFRSVYDEDLD